MPNQTATNPTEALWNLLDHVAQGRVRLEDVLRKLPSLHAARRKAYRKFVSPGGRPDESLRTAAIRESRARGDLDLLKQSDLRANARDD